MCRSLHWAYNYLGVNAFLQSSLCMKKVCLTALKSIFMYHIRHAIYRCLIFEMSVSLEVLNHVSAFHWTGLLVKNNSMLKNRFLAKFQANNAFCTNFWESEEV